MVGSFRIVFYFCHSRFFWFVKVFLVCKSVGKAGDVYLLRVIGELICLLLQEKKQIQEQSQPCTWRAVCHNQGIRILGMRFCCSFTAQNLQWQSLKVFRSGAELLKEKMKFGKLKSPMIMVPKYVFFSLFC